jgi:hypothetical protein
MIYAIHGDNINFLRGFKKDDYLNYIKIGESKNRWMSEVRGWMDEKVFLSLYEEDKRLLIWDKIKEGILKFIDLFPMLAQEELR